MAKRVCTQPGCPVLVTSGYCEDHRKTTSQRGYHAQHQQTRATWAPIVKQGKTPCRRCRALIAAGEPWDLGHPDAHCDYPTAPEHRACNRATAGRLPVDNHPPT